MLLPMTCRSMESDLRRRLGRRMRQQHLQMTSRALRPLRCRCGLASRDTETELTGQPLRKLRTCATTWSALERQQGWFEHLRKRSTPAALQPHTSDGSRLPAAQRTTRQRRELIFFSREATLIRRSMRSPLTIPTYADASMTTVAKLLSSFTDK